MDWMGKMANSTLEAALIARPAPWKISMRPAHDKGRRALPWQVLDAAGEVVGLFAKPMPAQIMVAAINAVAA